MLLLPIPAISSRMFDWQEDVMCLSKQLSNFSKLCVFLQLKHEGVWCVRNSMAKAEIKIKHQNLDVLLIQKKVVSVFQLAHRSHSDAQFCPKFLPLKKIKGIYCSEKQIPDSMSLLVAPQTAWQCLAACPIELQYVEK